MFTPFFVHIYAHNSAKMNSRTRGVTLYVRPSSGLEHHCTVSAARCNPKDQYCKKKGAEQAINSTRFSHFKMLELPRVCADIASEIKGRRVTADEYEYLLRRFFH